MTARRKKTLIITLIVLVVVSILRETGVFDFNLYRSTINSTVQTNWSDNSVTTKPTFKIDSVWRAAVADKCNHGGKLAGTPVVVTYRSTEYGDTGYCNPINVQIDDISFGVTWTPLIKSSNFSAGISCLISAQRTRIEDGQLISSTYTLNGSMTITGHITVWGICSYRNAKNILMRHIIGSVLRQVKSHIANK
jgi:hypothetical protein